MRSFRAIAAAPILFIVWSVHRPLLAATAVASTPESASPTHSSVGEPVGAREYKGQLDPIGPFTLLDLDGKRWTDRDFKGKVLIVEQWAAWCGPCIANFPYIQRLSDRVRSDPSIAFVALDMDRDLGAMTEFLKEFRKEYSFPILFGGERFRATSLPHTWIVDGEGFIRESYRGGGPGFVDQALGLAEAVKHRLPVSALPPEAREERRRWNEREGAPQH